MGREIAGPVSESIMASDPRGGKLPPDARIAFVLELGRALHQYGVAAPRLEAVLDSAACRLGLAGQFFSTPTSIFAGFGTLEAQRTYLLRVEPGGTDLGRLADTDAVVGRVLCGELDPGAGLVALERIRNAESRYGPTATILAYAMVSGAAARFLGGGAAEMAAAAGLGAVTGLLSLLVARVGPLERVFEPVAAFVVALLAALLAALTGAFALAIATLAALIVLIPGMSLTTALAELASRHLSSGTSRLSGAAITFLGIGLGVTLGYRVAGLGLAPAAPVLPAALPGWTNLVALGVAGVAFTVLLRAAWRDVPWIVAAGAVAFAGARLGGNLLGPELGVFVGALAVGLGSNFYARRLRRPPAVTEVPGLLTLVPGSIGFRSLTAMMEREVVSGVDTAFQMVMIAMALVAGLLIANLAGGRER
jgi:uncharacterized membrane protein YjjP (DUF1212 family)